MAGPSRSSKRRLGAAHRLNKIVAPLLRFLAETEYTEENQDMRVQPIGRRRNDLLGNDRPVKHGQLIGPHERANVQAGPGSAWNGSHIGTAALNGRDEADDEIGTAVIVTLDH